MNKKVINPAVCIPIYKSKFSKFELKSIKSHIFKLKAHDIYILIPKSQKYKIISSLKKHNVDESLFKIHQVNDYCLDRVDNYNNLLLNIEFYNFYKKYSHILIAHMDAYTFSDQLLKWCKSGWDYIGAPLYNQEGDKVNDFFCCGVGGFSLRSIKKTLEVLKENPTIYKFDDFREDAKNYNFKGKFLLVLKFIATKLLRKDRLVRSLIKTKTDEFSRRLYIFLNEDVSYSYYLPKYLKSFKVADFDNSIRFSIDGNVDESLKKLDFQLPFGVHSWFTHPKNLLAWEKYID